MSAAQGNREIRGGLAKLHRSIKKRNGREGAETGGYTPRAMIAVPELPWKRKTPKT